MLWQNVRRGFAHGRKNMDRLQKFLNKVDAVLRARVLAIIKRIEMNDLAGLDIKPLKGANGGFRCRVGDVRICFVRRGGQSIVLDIDFRGNVYKR